jgi:hypothetical protein
MHTHVEQYLERMRAKPFHEDATMCDAVRELLKTALFLHACNTRKPSHDSESSG